MKNSPRPIFLLHQTLQLSLCIGGGSVLLASAQTQICLSDSQMVKRDSSLHRMCFHCSRVQWQRALHSSRRLAFRMVRFLCGCSAMESHFMKLPMNSYCADFASRGSLELGSECYNRGQTMCKAVVKAKGGYFEESQI